MSKITTVLILMLITINSFGQTNHSPRKTFTPIIMSHNLLDIVLADTNGRYTMSTPLNKMIPALDSLMKRKFMGDRRLPKAYGFVFE